MPSYKSYCWALGTTSFRMVEFNRKIEQQLALLQEFWDIPENTDLNWSNNSRLQEKYYNFIREKNFIDGEAIRKDKDAREKTSGLVDLGLVNPERRLTPVGYELLNLTQSEDFNLDNILNIHSDSFIYFKQLLKLSYPFDNENIRPYILLVCFLSELGSLTKDEFTYLLPLATSQDLAIQILDNIIEIRNNNKTIDDVILDKLLNMSNYQEALNIFLNNDVSEDIIMDIGLNRKSKQYDRPYYSIYTHLHKLWENRINENVVETFNAIKGLKGGGFIWWKKLLFNTSSAKTIINKGIETLNENKLLNSRNEEEFRREFFNYLHLFKAKSLLADYYDLNKRYFKTTETILFDDNEVKLDIIPRCFFDICQDSLLNLAFISDINLDINVDLCDISNSFNISEQQIFDKVEELYGVEVRNLYDVQNLVSQERYDRFNQLVDEKFTNENIVELFTLFENRNDDRRIQAMVTSNADIPTIFEYVLAVAWYKISDRQGDVLTYMNLSLDVDLLPISHATGGHEDITYKYQATDDYPEHTLLIEATLATATNQRRMEMESVSRHLGDYMLENPQDNTYCVFATTYLHINVISDFRGRKNMPYYSNDGTKSIQGMKIIPCQTTEIKKIISNNIRYKQLYRLFETAYQSDLAPNIWYNEEIKNQI